jgi:sulfur-oxidizing protein SoxA
MKWKIAGWSFRHGAQAPGPESMITGFSKSIERRDYGSRARELRSRPGMTPRGLTNHWLSRGTTRVRGAIALSLLCGTVAFAADIPLDQRRSGYADLGRDTKAMQDDDTENPATLWVLDGETLWNTKAGGANKSCADCHGDATQSMKGVAARFPAYDAARQRPVDLEERINICRTDRQNATPLPRESKELLAFTVYVARQSRGMPVAEATDERLKPFIEQGHKLFTERQGQVNLSCAQCHDDNWGKRLAGNIVPQGHPTGYPIYRLEWQSLGSLQRRLRNCIVGMRAEPYAYGAPEYTALELFLMQRARGMTIETPGVRP